MAFPLAVMLAGSRLSKASVAPYAVGRARLRSGDRIIPIAETSALLRLLTFCHFACDGGSSALPVRGNEGSPPDLEAQRLQNSQAAGSGRGQTIRWDANQFTECAEEPRSGHQGHVLV